MPVKKESIETFEKAIADFKEAIAKSENICFDTAIVMNSASAQLSNLAKRMKARAEKGENPEELLNQILFYLQKKYNDTIRNYVNAVLIKYYYLLKCAETISENIATRKQKDELEDLQNDIDLFENIRSRIQQQFRLLSTNIARRHWPEEMAPAEYKSIAESVEDYLQNPYEDYRGNEFPPLKEDLDNLGEHVKRQIEIRFMELIQISEKLLGSAKVLESSEGVHM